MFFGFFKVLLLLLSVHYKCNSGVYFFFFQKLCCRWTGSSYRSLHSTSLQSITPKFYPLHSVSLTKSCKQNQKLTFCQVLLLVRLFCFSPFFVLCCFQPSFTSPSPFISPSPPFYISPPFTLPSPPPPLTLFTHPTPPPPPQESYITSNLYLWKRK